MIELSPPKIEINDLDLVQAMLHYESYHGLKFKTKEEFIKRLQISVFGNLENFLDYVIYDNADERYDTYNRYRVTEMINEWFGE